MAKRQHWYLAIFGTFKEQYKLIIILVLGYIIEKHESEFPLQASWQSTPSGKYLHFRGGLPSGAAPGF